MTRRATCIALAWALGQAACLGHGITATRIDGGVGVRATYDDGRPVTFIDASLFAPGAADTPTLTGTTDRDGCFMFRPDTQGVWRVTIADGMGHAVTQELRYDGSAAAAAAPAASRMPRRYGVIVGLSAIVGLFGWGAFLRLKLTGAARE